MADAFIYPLQQCGLDARSLAVADQVVRCLNNGNTEVAESSTRIFGARTSRLPGIEKAYALLVLRELYLANDRFKDARALGYDVRDHFTSAGDEFGLALNLSLDASIAYYKGDTAGSQRSLRHIEEIASRLGDPNEHRIVHVTQQLIEIRALMSNGQYPEALEKANRAKQTVKSITTRGKERLHNFTVCFRAKLHYFLHDYRDAERDFLRLIEQDWYIDEAATYLGRIKYHNRELDHAAEIFQQSLERFESKHNTRRVCNTKQELGRTWLEMDAVKKAEREFQETSALLKPDEFPFERGRALLGLAQCQYQRKDFPAALATVYDAVKIFDWIGNKQNQIRCRNLEAMALLELGKYERANAALAVAEEKVGPELDPREAATPHRLDWARVLRSKAVLAARQGRYDQAVEHSAGVIEILRRVHVPESDHLYVQVLLESALYLFMCSAPHEDIQRRLRAARRIADYRREVRDLVRVHVLRSAYLASRDLFVRAGAVLLRALAIEREDPTRHGRPVADIVMGVLDDYLTLAAPRGQQAERFVSGLAQLVESLPVDDEDRETREAVSALKERLGVTLSVQRAAHRGTETTSNVELLRLTIQEDRPRFGGPDAFFESLRTADYSEVIAAVRRCKILEEVEEFEKARLPDLTGLAQKYYPPPIES